MNIRRIDDRCGVPIVDGEQRYKLTVVLQKIGKRENVTQPEEVRGAKLAFNMELNENSASQVEDIIRTRILTAGSTIPGHRSAKEGTGRGRGRPRKNSPIETVAAGT